MKVKNYFEDLNVPEGIQVAVSGYEFTVKGPKGEIKRRLAYKGVVFEVKDGKVIIKFAKYTQNEKRMLYTFRAHLKNMFKGVTEGHRYRLKICSSHFPMNVSYSNNLLSIKNFIGEKVPRNLKIPAGVNLKIDGTEIVIDSTDIELAGSTASDIEKLTKRPAFDRRVFQDGIYITEKNWKAVPR